MACVEKESADPTGCLGGVVDAGQENGETEPARPEILLDHALDQSRGHGVDQEIGHEAVEVVCLRAGLEHVFANPRLRSATLLAGVVATMSFLLLQARLARRQSEEATTARRRCPDARAT